jgi:hypothetical protein
MPIVRRIALMAALAGGLLAAGALSPAPAPAQSCDPLYPQDCLIPGWDDPMQIIDCRHWQDEWSVILALPYPCIPPLGAVAP